MLQRGIGIGVTTEGMDVSTITMSFNDIPAAVLDIAIQLQGSNAREVKQFSAGTTASD